MTIVMNNARPSNARHRGRLNVRIVTLAHGGGGKAMRDLVDDVFVSTFDNRVLEPLEDQARERTLHGGQPWKPTDASSAT
jgi:hydrogenase expression/formation protein HypE